MKIIEYEEKYLEDVKDLLVELEEYFRSIGCEYISIEVFAYNKMGINFYEKHGYHTRDLFDIKKIN